MDLFPLCSGSVGAHYGSGMDAWSKAYFDVASQKFPVISRGIFEEASIIVKNLYYLMSRVQSAS